MIKLNRETKIGLLAVISLALLVWGIQYLKGINILANNLILYAEYDNVAGMRVGTPVHINGFEVGLVSQIRQKEDNPERLVVELNLNRGLKIPRDAVAEITPASFMGGHYVNLVFEGTCTEGTCAERGDTIQGRTLGLLASTVSTQDLENYMETLNKGLARMLDTLSNKLAQSQELEGTLSDVQATVSNLKSATARLDQLLAGNVQRTLQNVESLTATLEASNAQIENLLRNASSFSDQLATLDLQKTLQTTDEALRQLDGTLQTAQNALSSLDDLLQRLGDGPGTLPMLLNDPEMAASLRRTNKHLELLLQDMRLHPERYFRLGKKRKPYTPENDPALPSQ